MCKRKHFDCNPFPVHADEQRFFNNFFPERFYSNLQFDMKPSQADFIAFPKCWTKKCGKCDVLTESLRILSESNMNIWSIHRSKVRSNTLLMITIIFSNFFCRLFYDRFNMTEDLVRMYRCIWTSGRVFHFPSLCCLLLYMASTTISYY